MSVFYKIIIYRENIKLLANWYLCSLKGKTHEQLNYTCVFLLMAMSLLRVPDQLSYPDRFITGIVYPVYACSLGWLAAALTSSFTKTPTC
jgi:hypothetical protein